IWICAVNGSMSAVRRWVRKFFVSNFFAAACASALSSQTSMLLSSRTKIGTLAECIEMDIGTPFGLRMAGEARRVPSVPRLCQRHSVCVVPVEAERDPMGDPDRGERRALDVLGVEDDDVAAVLGPAVHREELEALAFPGARAARHEYGFA